MATPEDPVRALAERGVLHYTPDPVEYGARPHVYTERIKQSLPVDELGQSELAKTWELTADNAITPTPAIDHWGPKSRFSQTVESNGRTVMIDPETGEVMPGIYKSGDDYTRQYSVNRGHDLGFSHLLDELRNATNPASGLPLELQLKYSSLPQVSVPQAVERVAKINAWRAAQKAEADLARANNAATVLHKDYPDAGFKWVELKANRPQDVEVVNDGVNFVVKRGDEVLGKYASERTANQMADKVSEPALEQALKYEGDTMGHCVGGYCPDVLEGRSRIFSLRSAKGEPHVTVEVAPGQKAPEGAVAFDELPEAVRTNLAERGLTPSAFETGTLFGPEGKRYLSSADRIVQIKGKQNRAPNPEYLPYVQDFVKSGQWSDVGDLGNAGLRRTRDAWNENELGKILSAGHEVPEYLTPQEIQAIGEKVWPGQWGDVTKYAAGGAVTPQTDYDPQRIDAIVEQLRGELAAH